ncbi:trypsin-like peptidase domain-containing protein [Streptomyces sp. DT2A-34]|uniref:nSTAND1 domain-containing NTPase n=1 Tax=Streptomyces sp. DT2A-34 TaxID=3051182 RepID=UPI00265BE1A9|nr:trypsin-like peptidase domain-containing protein [Streptomyces sp. DT2A-34]MDO0914089.1 trypsin-like peptidase domain-containing protein [Streptomyces sp. DT2A-34]
MDETLARAVVRIMGTGAASGRVGGAGALVTEDRVLTCAHVVSDALGDTVAVGTEVVVDFPLAETFTDDGKTPSGIAVVEQWIPMRESDQTGDIAVLRLQKAVPGTRPVPMADPDTVWKDTARAVGFTGGEAGTHWFEGRLSGATVKGWWQLARADGETAHVRGGFSGSPVWDEDLGAAVGIIVVTEREGEARQTFVIRTRTLIRELRELPEASKLDLAPLLLPPSPFRGLNTFQEKDTALFFGRDGDIKEVVALLQGDDRTVTLCGPSGCGKSSLALAGAVPKMRAHGYEVLVVNAGGNASPVSALATSLYKTVRAAPEEPGAPWPGGADEVEERLATHSLWGTYHHYVRGRERQAPDDLLVVLDQAEALLDRTPTEIDDIVRLLAPEGPEGRALKVLATLRADVMHVLLEHPSLGPFLKRGRIVPLTPMSPDQLREVITKPVEGIPTVRYDPGLDQRILQDAGGEPGVLPLLGFVLNELWRLQERGRLTVKAYGDLGGVSGALAQHAKAAWEVHVGTKPAEDQAAARRLLTGLVRMLPGSTTLLRRRLTREEAGEGWPFALSFAKKRLLVLHGSKGGPESVELAHEALIDAWPELKQQTVDDRKFLVGRAELSHDRERWEEKERSPHLLPGRLQLRAIEDWLGERQDELTNDEKHFLDLARRRDKARRARVRAAWVAVAAVFALIVGLGTFLVYQSRVSEERDAEARSRALAVLSDSQVDQDVGLAALTAMAAYDVSPTQEARSALLRRYEELRDAEWVMSGAEGPVGDVATSVDGTVALMTTELGRATLFVREAGGQVSRTQLRAPGRVFQPMVARDGRRIAYMTAAGSLVWHDVRPAAKEVLGRAHPLSNAHFAGVADAKGSGSEPTDTADLSPDADQVATLLDGRIRLWDLRTGRSREVPGHDPELETVRFGPDSGTVVAERQALLDDYSSISSMVSISASTGKTRELAKEVDTSSSSSSFLPSLSGDGRVLAVCRSDSDNGSSSYWSVRVADGQVLGRYESEDGSCSKAALDATGQRFVVNDGDDWFLVDNGRGKSVRNVAGPSPDTRLDRLLQSPRGPVVSTWGVRTMKGLPLEEGTENGRDWDNYVFGAPKLLNGTTMVMHRGRSGSEGIIDDELALVDLETGRTTASVKRPDKEAGSGVGPFGAFLYPAEVLAVNEAGTLVADIVGENKIIVRELPSLRQTAEITTRMPPADTSGEREPLRVDFGSGNRLVTVSGSWIESWNAPDGRRLSEPFDVRALHLSEKNPPLFSSEEQPEDSGFWVNSHPKPGYVQIMVQGDPILHAVHLGTGKENRGLRVELGGDIDRAFLDPSGRYALAKTLGGLVELWSLKSGSAPERVAGPFGPLTIPYLATFVNDGDTFLIANANSVRVYDTANPGHVEFYDFGPSGNIFFGNMPQQYLGLGDEGTSLVRSKDGQVDLLRLDPARWKSDLCRTLGRDITPDERRGLPEGLPDTICPQGQGGRSG